MNTIDKADKLLYNSIPVQQLLTPNSLTIRMWNDYINQLRVQTNELTTFNKELQVILNAWIDDIESGLSTYKNGVNTSLAEMTTNIATKQDQITISNMLDASLISYNDCDLDTYLEYVDAHKQDKITNDDPLSALLVRVTGVFGENKNAKDVFNILKTSIDNINVALGNTLLQGTITNLISSLLNRVQSLEQFEKFKIVSTLPNVNNANFGTIYLKALPSDDVTSNNVYEEYILVEYGSNKSYECLGKITSSINRTELISAIEEVLASDDGINLLESMISTILGNYYTKIQIDETFATKQMVSLKQDIIDEEHPINAANVTYDSDRPVSQAISELEEASVTHITDSPSDGKQYARKDGTWNEIVIPKNDNNSVSTIKRFTTEKCYMPKFIASLSSAGYDYPKIYFLNGSKYAYVSCEGKWYHGQADMDYYSAGVTMYNIVTREYQYVNLGYTASNFNFVNNMYFCLAAPTKSSYYDYLYYSTNGTNWTQTDVQVSTVYTQSGSASKNRWTPFLVISYIPEDNKFIALLANTNAKTVYAYTSTDGKVWSTSTSSSTTDYPTYYMKKGSVIKKFNNKYYICSDNYAENTWYSSTVTAHLMESSNGTNWNASETLTNVVHNVFVYDKKLFAISYNNSTTITYYVSDDGATWSAAKTLSLKPYIGTGSTTYYHMNYYEKDDTLMLFAQVGTGDAAKYLTAKIEYINSSFVVNNYFNITLNEYRFIYYTENGYVATYNTDDQFYCISDTLDCLGKEIINKNLIETESIKITKDINNTDFPFNSSNADELRCNSSICLKQFDSNYLYYSTDGTNWTKSTVTYSIKNIYVCDDVFYYKQDSTHIYVSTDGINWTLDSTKTMPYIDSSQYNNNCLIKFKNKYYSIYSQKVYESSDNMATWTQTTGVPYSSSSFVIYYLVVVNDALLAITNYVNSTVAYYTLDGTTWKNVTIRSMTAEEFNIPSYTYTYTICDNKLYLLGYGGSSGYLKLEEYKVINNSTTISINQAQRTFSIANANSGKFTVNKLSDNSIIIAPSYYGNNQCMTFLIYLKDYKSLEEDIYYQISEYTKLPQVFKDKLIFGITNGAQSQRGIVVTTLKRDKTDFLPTPPVVDGNYLLKVSIVNGTPTYSWVLEE